jgi:hypothetical protein
MLPDFNKKARSRELGPSLTEPLLPEEALHVEEERFEEQG